MNVKGLGPSADDIQHHLYASFLEGSTADVALRVHGTWDAIYKLHRVVLIQSGFFRSLFTAGFAESSPRLGSSNGPEEIVIHFDDPNITRAAFEICISRLYGGGPPLDIAPCLIPSLPQPLTTSFPNEPPPHKVPAHHHPATPRFLLSLLATAVYLSIPSLASQAMTYILSTVGPRTVLKYLNFALGRHIGILDHEPGEPEAAVGLESVAHIIEYERSVAGTASLKENSSILGDYDVTKDHALETRGTISSTSYDSSEDYETEGVWKQPYHYGAISVKIGEACACWLARWGIDLLPYEERIDEMVTPKNQDLFVSSRKRSKTVPSGPSSSMNDVSADAQKSFCIPLIWSCGGLNAKWAAAIISADTFFVRGERERYEVARRVVELRRKSGVVLAEEEEWVKLFDHGIYYANMTVEDLMFISQDISPTTKRPFVPLTTLQAAHWTQSTLRHHITVRPMVSPHLSPLGSIPSPAPRDKELGITQTTADILAGTSSSISDPKVYFPIPGSSSIRIGDNGSNFNSTAEGGSLSMDQLFTSTSSLSPPPSSPTQKPNTVTASVGPLTSEADFFGLRASTFTAASAISSDTTGKSQWSTYPPHRFAVEFWDLEFLKEKSRIYSHTIWYAGSLFNIYVQIVRKKGQAQLGIYLHRQSTIEPIPPSSAPAYLVTRIAETLTSSSAGNVAPTASQRPSHQRGPSLPALFSPSSHTTSHYSPSIYPSSRSTTPLSSGNMSTSPSSPGLSSPSSLSSSSTGSITLPATSAPAAPPQPYRDPRPSISAYFTISCASATGSSQTRFTSSPDVFSVGQSWGWKSSSLRTEEYMDVRTESTSTNRDPSSKEASLRATIVLGLV